VITTEIEHINCDALEELEKSGCSVQPHSSTFRLIQVTITVLFSDLLLLLSLHFLSQNKYLQKVHLSEHSIPLPEFCEIKSIEDCQTAGERYGYPYVLKNCCLAYDGRGNAVIHSSDEIEACFLQLGGETQQLYAEKFVPFIKELAVMIVRSKSTDPSGEDVISCYPVVETIQTNSICDLVICPAHISPAISQRAVEIATEAVKTLTGWGVFGVEMFLLATGEILLNEIAPRSLSPPLPPPTPHSSQTTQLRSLYHRIL
jgi:phosphoribosylaminoimidazole carboxylase